MPLYIPLDRTGNTEHLADKYVTFDDLRKYTLYYDKENGTYTGSTINGADISATGTTAYSRAIKNIVTSGAVIDEVPYFKENRPFANGSISGVPSRLGVRWADTTEFNPYCFFWGLTNSGFNVMGDDGTERVWWLLNDPEGEYRFHIKFKGDTAIYTVGASYINYGSDGAWDFFMSGGGISETGVTTGVQDPGFFANTALTMRDVEYIEWYEKPTFTSFNENVVVCSDSIKIVFSVASEDGDSDYWSYSCNINFGETVYIDSFLSDVKINERNKTLPSMWEIEPAQLASNFNITTYIDNRTKITVHEGGTPQGGKATITVPYEITYDGNIHNSGDSFEVSLIADLGGTGETISNSRINIPETGETFSGTIEFTADTSWYGSAYVKCVALQYAHDGGSVLNSPSGATNYSTDMVCGIHLSGITAEHMAIYPTGPVTAATGTFSNITAVTFDGFWEKIPSAGPYEQHYLPSNNAGNIARNSTLSAQTYSFNIAAENTYQVPLKIAYRMYHNAGWGADGFDIMPGINSIDEWRRKFGIDE